MIRGWSLEHLFMDYFNSVEAIMFLTIELLPDLNSFTKHDSFETSLKGNNELS